MKKKELIERIAEGSPVAVGIPAGEKTVYVLLDKDNLLKVLKKVNGNANLPCATLGHELPREKTSGWIVWFDLV